MRDTGTVGVIGMDTGRFNEFALSMGRLKRPDDWEVMGALNYSEEHARNWLADHFKGDWLWFIDDDHGFKDDTLRRLVTVASALNVDVVAPLVLQRRAPFLPVAYRDGAHVELNEVTQEEVDEGLLPVDQTGTAGMLIRRTVFHKLERPYFASESFIEADGTETFVPSDTRFCRKLRAAGIEIYVDLDTIISHYNVVAVTPRWQDGRWVTSFAIGHEECFVVGNELVNA